MGRTPDAFTGPRIEEEIQFDEQSSDPAGAGRVRYVSGAFRMQDSTGIFDPRSGGGGVTEAQHKVLRQLIHFIDDGPAEGFSSGAYKEILPSGSVFPTSEIWYESSSKLKNIVGLWTTWSGATITQEKWKIYDTDGTTVLWTITDAISYSGIQETSRTRTITSGDA